MMNSLEHCINSAKFSEGQIKMAEEIVLKLPELRTVAKNAFLAERAFLTGTPDKEIYGGSFAKLFTPISIVNIVQKPFKHLPPILFIMSGLVVSSRIDYIEYMDKMIGMFRTQYDEKALADFESRYEPKMKGIRGSVCRLLTSPLSSIVRKSALVELNRSLIILALATREFESKHGHLPDSLDELIPNFIAEIPQDVFDKKQIKSFNGEIQVGVEYEAENADEKGLTFPFFRKSHPVMKKGLIIYSVGTDGIDNSGGAFGKRWGLDTGSDISVIVLPMSEK
jgi:hypothetical protein